MIISRIRNNHFLSDGQKEMDYFGKNRVKIMIIDRIRSTEYPGKRKFRLFFCAPGKGKIFLIENAYILFYDCSSRQR